MTYTLDDLINFPDKEIRHLLQEYVDRQDSPHALSDVIGTFLNEAYKYRVIGTALGDRDKTILDESFFANYDDLYAKFCEIEAWRDLIGELLTQEAPFCHLYGGIHKDQLLYVILRIPT